MKIGVTERGDPSIDLSWIEKLDDVDGAIVITKHLTNEIIKKSKPYYDKLIFHITCTGYGLTKLEPRIPTYDYQIDKALELIEAGVDYSHVVIRVDPIIPTEKGLKTAKNVFNYAYSKGFKRFRVSLLDCYPHVRDRLKKCGFPLPYGENEFQPSQEMIDNANNLFLKLKRKYPDIVIESCAEKGLTETDRCGCISKKDFEILGLDTSNVDDAGYQRSGCLCCSAKTELLTNKVQCPYGCIYCYWKNKGEEDGKK